MRVAGSTNAAQFNDANFTWQWPGETYFMYEQIVASRIGLNAMLHAGRNGPIILAAELLCNYSLEIGARLCLSTMRGIPPTIRPTTVARRCFAKVSARQIWCLSWLRCVWVWAESFILPAASRIYLCVHTHDADDVGSIRNNSEELYRVGNRLFGEG